MKQAEEHYFADFYNANDPEKAAALVEALVADDFVDYSPAFGGAPTKAGFKQTVALINQTIAQHYRVHTLLRDGNHYVAIWTSDCTHVGAFMGVAPTHKQFTITGITVYEIVNGKIRAHWEQFDVLTLLQNIGIVQLPQA